MIYVRLLKKELSVPGLISATNVGLFVQFNFQSSLPCILSIAVKYSSFWNTIGYEGLEPEFPGKRSDTKVG